MLILTLGASWRRAASWGEVVGSRVSLPPRSFQTASSCFLPWSICFRYQQDPSLFLTCAPAFWLKNPAAATKSLPDCIFLLLILEPTGSDSCATLTVSIHPSICNSAWMLGEIAPQFISMFLLLVFLQHQIRSTIDCVVLSYQCFIMICFAASHNWKRICKG